MLYHGSAQGDILKLKPYVSEHGKPYVYFAENPVVALLYAIKPVPKPYSFYPFGFDKTGAVVYSEYFPDAFSVLYKGKTGYLYEAEERSNMDMPTHIPGVYTSKEPVLVKNVTEIPDLYARFMEWCKEGRFRIKPRDAISDKEMAYVFSALKQDMEKYEFIKKPECEMSRFIRTYFPEVWNEYLS